MKKSFGTKMKVLALSALTAVASSTFTSCQNEIAEENRFTFTGELIADHLKKHPEKYSHFCTILEKAKFGKKGGNMLTVLSTYGSYTCFAPSNEGVEQYLSEKYNEWKESYDAWLNDKELEIKNTGITSPDLEDLSDSMATVIARNHIIELGITTDEVGQGAFPKKTMNRRSVMLGWEEETGIMTVDGKVVVEENIETENGYIHFIQRPLAPSDQSTSALLATQQGFDIFNAALKATGWDKYLDKFELNSNYEGLGQYGPPFQTQGKQEPPYPEANNQGYTLLVETDDLLRNPDNNHFKIEINDIHDLEFLAAHYYGKLNSEKTDWEYKGKHSDPNNPLYKFIAYHIIDRKLLYSSGKGTGGFLMEGYQTFTKEGLDEGKFDSEENMPTSYDRYDYFETAYPYTLIKVTKPFSNTVTPYTRTIAKDEVEEVGLLKEQLVINYAQDMSERCVNDETSEQPMKKHINVVIEFESTTRERWNLPNFEPQAMNGMIYTIDKILIYNEDEMKNNILNERMRWDVFSLFPELTNNDVRWMPEDSKYTLTYIPEGYCSRLRHNNTDTHIYYLRPHNAMYDGGYANYQGDEMLVTGKYDFQYRIPYVPAGSYEIRFGFSTSDSRGVAQFYFGKEGKLEICGIPLDMRNSNQAFMGWVEETTSEEENRKNDKAMRNRGFMKAPASIWLGSYDSSKPDKNMRYAQTAYRRIVCTPEIEYSNGIVPENNYWLRFKDVTEGGTDEKPNEFNQDYLEIVPLTIVNNAAQPEDIY